MRHASYKAVVCVVPTELGRVRVSTGVVNPTALYGAVRVAMKRIVLASRNHGFDVKL